MVDPEVTRLKAALPAAAENATVLVRRLRSGVWSAVVRDPDGGAPAVYAWPAGATEPMPLRPETDPGLPGGHLLGDDRALAERLGLPTDRPIRTDVVAYRPEKRAVVRIDGGERGVLYLKLLTRRAHAAAMATLSGLPAERGVLRLALPLHDLADEAAFVTPAAAGRSLHEILLAGEEPRLPLLDAGVRALAEARVESLPARSAADERASSHKMLCRGAEIVPELGALRDRVRDLRVPNLPGQGLVHADLHDKQLFLGDDTVTLIDLEGMRWGDPRIDRANLVEHVRLRGLQSPAAWRAEPVAETLARRWELDDGRPEPRLLRGLVRARLAGVYGQRPRWRELALRLAREAEELLASAGGGVA